MSAHGFLELLAFAAWMLGHFVANTYPILASLIGGFAAAQILRRRAKVHPVRVTRR